jgi:hypothetical protein
LSLAAHSKIALHKVKLVRSEGHELGDSKARSVEQYEHRLVTKAEVVGDLSVNVMNARLQGCEESFDLWPSQRLRKRAWELGGSEPLGWIGFEFWLKAAEFKELPERACLAGDGAGVVT